ncbi:hypothetical protein ISN44_As12g008050 [Arabidopsis suecica]|uniref:Uncharacterized protein n=1 Tax=Arabidopsis suecica TaxID=45249 RepID=A0A8T1YGZ8_ARASU|nr:hypothetical protein ISN44_As12g008050 [Arabidopsis suecica]
MIRAPHLRLLKSVNRKMFIIAPPLRRLDIILLSFSSIFFLALSLKLSPLTMAEKKPWDHLRDGINDLWKSFGASDDNDLSLFCKNRSDERIPESFLEKFISKLEEAKWTLSEDPDYKTPQELMDKVFQATKKKMMEKLRKQNKKKVAEDEKKEEIVQQEEAIVQQEEAIVPVEVVEEEEEVVLTEEQLKLNLEVKRKSREEWAKLKKIQSQERAEKTRIYQRDLTMANRTLSMNNELIGCDKEAQRQKGK